MNILRRFGNFLARMMYGRNGFDQLGFAGVWASLIIELCASVFQWEFVYYFGLVLWIWVMFRAFSKNLTKRRAENAKWLQFWGGIKGSFTGASKRRHDKEHKYFTCKNCKAICRVPVGKGQVVITCPKCGGEIRGKS